MEKKMKSGRGSFARPFVTVCLLAAALFASTPAHLSAQGTCIDDVTNVTNNCTANDVNIAILFNDIFRIRLQNR